MSTHANRVKMTVASVAADPYTITLDAASSGFRSFATAYGANATVDVLITMGTTWEIARNCTYTHSGTTLSRGTLENSSTGSRITTFDNTAVVSVIATAAFGNNAALNHVAASPTTAGVTGVVGTMHLLDISGLTASRNFTLPATAAVGDRVGVYLTTGDAAYELIIIGDTGDTINGGSANTEWSRLFIANECVILRCITANSAWIVEYDGRIPSTCAMLKDTNTTITNATPTVVPLNEIISNPHGMADAATNFRINIRRGNAYLCSARFTAYNAAITAFQGRIYNNGNFAVLAALDPLPANSTAPPVVAIISFNAGEYAQLYAYRNGGVGTDLAGADGDPSCSLSVVEVM